MLRKLLMGLKRSKKTGAMIGLTSVAAVASAIPAMAAPPDPGLDFGSGDFDFTLADVVATAWNFLNIFPTWVQLVLGIMAASTFIGFILWIFSKLPKFRARSN